MTMNTGTCASCGAALRWAKTKSQKLMPLDPESTTGNVRLNEAEGTCEVLGGANRGSALAAGERLYTSHFATCPGAAAHRKPKS